MREASDRRLGVEVLYDPATVFGGTRMLRPVVATLTNKGMQSPESMSLQFYHEHVQRHQTVQKLGRL